MQRNILLTLGSLGAMMLGNSLAAQAQAPLFSTVAGTTAVTGSALPTPNLVTPLDTFSFDISGYNNAGTVGYLLTPVESGTFGSTTTFTGAGINGQNITITSSETIGATTTTDTFTVSTPTNFLTTANVSGTKITQLFFDLGLESGTDPVNVLLPISSYTATGSTLYSGGNLAVTPVTSLGTDSASYSAYEGVSGGTTAISNFAVHSFTYSITYATLAAAPEPSAWAGLIIGGLGLGLLGLRAYKRRLDDAFGPAA